MFKNFGSFIMTQRSAFKAPPPWLLPIVAFAITEGLFLIMQILGLNLHGPVIPMSLGLIKDLADVVLVVLFPWDGWVFAVPLVLILALGTRYKYLMATYLLSTTSTAFISSWFNFRESTVERIATGIFTYAVINIFVFVFVSLFVFLLKSFIKGVLKCRQ